MMNAAHFDYSPPTGYFNSAEHHQAYRSFQNLSLMPSAASVASAYANTAPNLRTGQSTIPVTNDGSVSSNYGDPTCKLYDSNQSGSQNAAASATFKSECSLSIKSDPNGFKTPEHQTPNAWSSAVRPSPSSGMSTPDMRNFEAAAVCSRQMTDWANGFCTNQNMNASPMGTAGNAFYPWMAIAGEWFA